MSFKQFIKQKIQTAKETFFDPTNCDAITSNNVQDAVDELCDRLAQSASPGYSFGRSGNTPSNTWMLRTGGAPSNKTGITVGFSNPVITNVTIANENITTFDVGIYEHDGDEVNLTLLGTVSVVSARSAEFSTSINVTQGKQLATRITSGSAKNPGVDIQLSGTI